MKILNNAGAITRRERILREPTTLNAAATYTVEFDVTAPDTWVLIKHSSVSAGTLVGTLTYVSPSGVRSQPDVLELNNSTTDAKNNAITRKGLYPGTYELSLTPATANATGLAVSLMEFI